MTLREIHERCKARHFVDESSGAHHPERPWCGFCFHSWPCADYADAVAALKALDEAEWSTLYAATTEGPDQPHYFRLVSDPEVPDA